MIPLVTTALLLLGMFGHAVFWVFLVNRLHATPLPRLVIKVVERFLSLIMLAIAVYFLWPHAAANLSVASFGIRQSTLALYWVYPTVCWLAACYITALWLWRKSTPTQPQLISNDTTLVDVAEQLGYRPIGRWLVAALAHFPGNEVFKLSIHEKTLSLPRLSSDLDGLTVAHLSDLHLTGYVGKEYFEFVVDQTNQLDADLVAITGDIFDKPKCLDWIDDTLGRLKSRYGVYFVLGNHDKRIRDTDDLRRRLTGAGLIDMGGRWLTVDVRGQGILLAGNELPWFGRINELNKGRPDDDEHFALKLLLAHTPDQIRWARSADFDLMLAGHTHGGQIRLPVIGPIFSPSNYGVKYASGVFYEEPTLMHVSRGISGVEPIRLNCPPELAKLVLRSRTETI